MDLMEKIERAIEEINPRYNLTSYKLETIRKNTSALEDGISKGFIYGYLQGMKAAEAKLKEKPKHEPKYKNELRQALYYQISHTKNTIILQRILKITDILRRNGDDEEYKTLTELEWTQAIVISDILRCDDEKRIRNVRAFMNGYLSDSRKRRAGAMA